MAQDLRDLFKEEREKKYPMKQGHEARFAARLERARPKTRKSPFRTLGIAASLLLVAGLGALFYLQQSPARSDAPAMVEESNAGVREVRLSLGDLSPDLKKVEQYYVANINLQLAELEISDDNKAMVDSFMERLAVLNKEYDALNQELNTLGPNDQTINALINNLQLRLEMLYKLKEKLETLKSTENDTESSQSV